MKSCYTLLLTAVLTGACAGIAQTSTFEVASVKPNVSGEPAGGRISPPGGGRFQANNVTLRTLIRTAYDIQDFQIVGGPKWLDRDKFDVNAKADGNAGWPEIRIMLQGLLANRFRLSVNRESRVMPVYAMVIAKDGPKLGAPTDAACQPPPLGACGGIRIVNGNTLSGINVSTAQIARVLMTLMGRPVIDKTGLTGVFDFKMDPVNDLFRLGEPPNPDGPAAQSNGSSIFTALEEELGLKLISQKSAVEMIVISQAEEPAAN